MSVSSILSIRRRGAAGGDGSGATTWALQTACMLATARCEFLFFSGTLVAWHEMRLNGNVGFRELMVSETVYRDSLKPRSLF